MNKAAACLTSVIISAVSALSAETRIINPQPGTWANRQMLVLAISDEDDAYYSLNGSDPLSSGFAYDGPVLVDVDGPVELRITAVSPDGTKRDQTVSYEVTPASPRDPSSVSFIQNMQSRGIITYTAGTKLDIPSSLMYSFGTGDESYLAGASLSYDENCIMTRYIPLTVTDGTAKWHYVIQTMPSSSGTYSKRAVPFTVKDWTTIVFNDRKSMYKIDGGMWGPQKDPVQLDRSVSHMISWQSVAYEKGNPVEFFVLPPKPELSFSEDDKGAVKITVKGGGDFRLGIVSSQDSDPGLFETASLDTFTGDETAGTAEIGIYSDSVYQGSVPVTYDIDRKAPPAPVIISSCASGLSRKPVDVEVHCGRDDTLYVRVQGPSSDSAGFEKTSSGVVRLEPSAEGAVRYVVTAYAADRKGNTGAQSSYTVVIDAYNYYLDASADPSAADGTETHPFTSFGQFAAASAGTRFSRLTVNGAVQVPSGDTVFTGNCEIRGVNSARLVFGGESSLAVRSASLDLSDLIIEYTEHSDASHDDHVPFISLEHSVLSAENCIITAVFEKNGIAVDSSSSVLTLSGCTLTAKAPVYASCVSAVASKIKVNGCTVSSVGDTAVDFSAQDGDFELRSSSCRITGRRGRSAELFGAHSRITGCTFTGELEQSGKTGNAVFTDSRAVSVEYSGNTAYGF